MAIKPLKTSASVSAPNTIKAVTVIKVGPLQYLTLELEITDGFVTSYTQVNRAPDLPGMIIPGLTFNLWELRDQELDASIYCPKID